MNKRLEVHMIKPVRKLMSEKMGIEVIAKEFSSGYGVADLIGGVLSKKNCKTRYEMGIEKPFDHRYIFEVLSTLNIGVRRTLKYITNRISFSESTLKKKILPKMESYGLIKREDNGFICLLKELPHPTERIVAIELKQTKWREAIIQARRYTFFADRTYIAVWNGSASRVNLGLLNKYRIGLIGVEPDYAEILIKAPIRKPRNPIMNCYCAEFLYRKALFS